ncbi:MAG: tetratricopeptide repeat protein [Gemmatimonadetes bacterium]|jgi:lipoprotein NlpI|nr:tetratricopeptide repeat protein [Gemmatimonadota bacterium]
MAQGKRTALFGLLGVGLVAAWMVACNQSSRDASALTSAGVNHLQQGAYDEAIRDFDRALALQPGLVVAWRNRGLAHKAKGDYDRALADYEQAIVFAPTDARLYNERGTAFAGMSDFTHAIADFNHAISLKPDHEAAITNRGRINFVLGNFAQAAADLQRGLSLDSADADAALWLHIARMRLAQDDASDFAAHAAAVDSTRWPAPLLRYFLGTLPAQELRLAAKDSTTGTTSAAGAAGAANDRACATAFFLGEDALLRKDAAAASGLFDEARTVCPKEATEHKAAAAELQRLKGQRR